MKYLRHQASRRTRSGFPSRFPRARCDKAERLLGRGASLPPGCRTRCCLPKGCRYLLQDVLVILLSLSLNNACDPCFFLAYMAGSAGLPCELGFRAGWVGFGCRESFVITCYACSYYHDDLISSKAYILNKIMIHILLPMKNISFQK